MNINGVNTTSITKIIGKSLSSVVKFNGVVVTTPVTSFDSASIGDANTGVACTFTTDTTRYHNGISSYPQVGDKVYNEAGKSDIVNKVFKKSWRGDIALLKVWGLSEVFKFTPDH